LHFLALFILLMIIFIPPILIFMTVVEFEPYSKEMSKKKRSIIYMIGVLILVLPSFLQSNSKLKQFLSNLSIWVIIVLIVTTISYFLIK
jgi:purine-cytosine permease-like protein